MQASMVIYCEFANTICCKLLAGIPPKVAPLVLLGIKIIDLILRLKDRRSQGDLMWSNTHFVG